MPLKKIVLKPGINKEGTRYSTEGGYYACDKVRFKSGYPESIGGWTPYSTFEFYGACYSMMAYTSLTGDKLLALGTHMKFYMEYGSYFYDLTPYRDSSTIASNAFSTDTTKPTIIVVNDTAHGAETGDFVTISTVAGPINGVPEDEVNGNHQVTKIDANSFSFTITTAPTSTGTTGACTIEYEVAIGLPYYVSGTGWGTGTWGRGTWGSSATGVSLGNLRIWNVDNYGEAIIYGPNGGGLYYWDFTAGTNFGNRGVLISSIVGANEVPLYQNSILVSDQRFVIVGGTNDFGDTALNNMCVRWSDQENYLEWEPMATTQAGSFILTSGSEILTMHNGKAEILVWTDTAIYSMQYLGPPLVYGFTLLAANTSLMGPNAAIVVDGIAYWMGKDKFFVYDGQVQPLTCDIRTYVFGDINPLAGFQVSAGLVAEFNEVWWLYASTDANSPDSYVIYNYVEKTWAYGTMDRTFWYGTDVTGAPIATTYDSDTTMGKIYYHEDGCDDGTTDPVSPINAYIETSDFDIDDGYNFGLVRRIIPDMTFRGSTANSPVVTLSVNPKRFSGSAYGAADEPTVTRTSETPVEQYTEQVYVRIRGRQMNFKIESNSVGTKWQMGAPRIDIRPDGRK